MLERSAVGTPEECRDMLQRYVEHGLTKYALWPACPPAQLLRQLAYYAQDIVPYFEPRDVSLATS
jgi:alkanesulfonate monooxygenase SsuD/methylene tetrahydromethanopterin reductase-like flavin-dependent oxidoreductase (luciferase family)